MSAYQAQLARWLQLLATKGVQELTLVNCPWPLDVPLPTALFGIASFTCLYISLWKFPDMARLPTRTSFPHLWELDICSVVMEDGDIDVVVAERAPSWRPQHPWMQQGAAPSPRQPEPPVRPNLQLRSGGHRRGEGSSPRAAHP
uniref:F-box/LRR-repeat protein 15/At3g58940/PEG3-like LRR domain-containing protein n=1 Tax=Aegilops tauschii subsp. strangulata TaxID=200361 RepID=A0A453AE97_AEGTS